MSVEDLRQDPMMAHLLASLEQGNDIGQYGHLTFTMVARHFLEPEELMQYLMMSPALDEQGAKRLITQVEARGYNPPKRERILEWMGRQEFPICADPDDPDQCNVYKSLNFPKEVYDRIQAYYEGKAEANEKSESDMQLQSS